MNLLQEITILSNAYYAGKLTVDQYYELCDILIQIYKLERQHYDSDRAFSRS